MGLMPETAYACAFWFLFAPSEAVQSAYSDVAAELASTEGIKIGIQVRAQWHLGHNFLKFDNADLPCDSVEEADEVIAAFGDHFACAQILENSLQDMGLQQVKWFLVSDYAKLRNCAATKYTSKLIGHRHQYGQFEHMRSAADTERAIINTVGDQLMLAETDYVISKVGNFGRSAALLHNRWRSYIRVPQDTDRNLSTACRHGLTFEEMASIPPGV